MCALLDGWLTGWMTRKRCNGNKRSSSVLFYVFVALRRCHTVTPDIVCVSVCEREMPARSTFSFQWSVSAFIFFPLANVKLMKVHFHSHRIGQQLWRRYSTFVRLIRSDYKFCFPTISSLAGISTAINRVTSCHCTAADHRIDKMHVTRRRNISEPHTDTHKMLFMKIALDSSPHATPTESSNGMQYQTFSTFLLVHTILMLDRSATTVHSPFAAIATNLSVCRSKLFKNYGFACKSQITSLRFVLDSTKTA